MNPCYKCVERVFGCHSKCIKYNEWKNAREEKMTKIRNEKKKEYELLEEPFRAVERSKK